MKSKKSVLSILLLLTLLVTACGPSETDPSIATAVAMTVAAQNTQQARPTNTPVPTEAAPTSTPEATPTQAAPPTAPPASGSNGDPCLLANLVSETIPDGTIMQPGETYLKTWRLKNGGTCTWDASYKIVYWSGDLMGGLYEYPFPEVVGPGQEANVSIYLKAPENNGNYTGFWKIQSPWGGAFGVGQYDTPFYVQVNVNDAKNPSYGVTNVTYQIDRKPAVGCATNIFWTVNATITTNGPADVKYRWLQSDGNDSGIRELEFEEASSRTISREWSMHLGVTTGTKWMQIVIIEPNPQEFSKATFTYDCQ